MQKCVILCYGQPMEEFEIKIWADLEYELQRDPTDQEFEDRMNRILLNLPYDHDDHLEEVANGN